MEKTGVVRAYNYFLGKGLIKCDDGSPDIPIYKQCLERSALLLLKTGDSVLFDVEYKGNSPVILAIELLDQHE